MQKEETIKTLMLYKDKMFRYAYNMVKDRFLAEDILQEALVKIWKKKEQFAAIENQEAWCITITRNLAIDKIRSAKKKQTSDIANHYDVSDVAPAPDRRMMQKETLRKVHVIMNELPELQREIITLRDIEGYTYQEIADLLELKVDQVKVYLHRSRKALREKLEHLRGAY